MTRAEAPTAAPHGATTVVTAVPARSPAGSGLASSPPASTPSRWRIAGSVPPMPPMRSPFTANRPATASKDRVPPTSLATEPSRSVRSVGLVTAESLTNARRFPWTEAEIALRESPARVVQALISPVHRSFPRGPSPWPPFPALRQPGSRAADPARG